MIEVELALGKELFSKGRCCPAIIKCFAKQLVPTSFNLAEFDFLIVCSKSLGYFEYQLAASQFTL